MKNHVVGGKLHKIDSASSSNVDGNVDEGDIFRSNTEHNGYVRYIKDLEADKDEIGKLQKASSNILESVVIAFAKDQVDEASKLFPDAVILTPDEVVGLEYKKVILYNPFYKDSMLYLQNQIQEKYDAQKPAPTNYPRDLDNIGFAIPFNELFVAVTRSTSDLYILDLENRKTSNKAVHDFFARAFTGIFDQYNENESEIGKELSLEALVAYIEENASTYQESVLAKYVEKVMVKILVQDGLDDRGKLSFFKRLDKVVKKAEIIESIKEIIWGNKWLR
jgi:hypothetical protein